MSIIESVTSLHSIFYNYSIYTYWHYVNVFKKKQYIILFDFELYLRSTFSIILHRTYPILNLSQVILSYNSLNRKQSTCAANRNELDWRIVFVSFVLSFSCFLFFYSRTCVYDYMRIALSLVPKQHKLYSYIYFECVAPDDSLTC